MIDLATQIQLPPLAPPIFIEIASPSNYLPLIAGLVGTVLGGLISWLIARQANNRQIARDEKQRREEEKASAIQTMLKISEIANSLFTIRNYIKAGLKSAKADNVAETKIYQYVQPTIGFSEDVVKFETKDFIPYISARKLDVLNTAGLIARRQKSILRMFETYCDRHVAFQDWMANFSQFDEAANTIEHKIPNSDKGKLIIRESELNGLLSQIAEFLEEQMPVIGKLCVDASTIGKDYFGDPRFFSIAGSPDNEFAQKTEEAQGGEPSS